MTTRALITPLAGLAVLSLCVQGLPALAQDKAAADSPKEESRTRLLKSWSDTVKVDGEDFARRYEIVFDYNEGLAQLKTYDEKGFLLESKAMMAGQPRPSDEEFAEAIAIVRADKVIGGMTARVRAVPDGGFLLEEEEGKACGPRTRCVHVLWLSPDRVGLVRWTVVDLVRQSIIYRAYRPPEQAATSREVSK